MKDQKQNEPGRSIVRNLDLIQETDRDRGTSRASAMVMASFGGACVVFAALALMRSPAEADAAPADPLGDLVAASQGDAPRPDGDRIDTADVTFPAVLTDQEHPTTAMEAVRRRKNSAPPEVDGADSELPRAPSPADGFASSPYDGPPPATDRLPVVPLPAQDVLAGTPEANIAGSDTLRNLAKHVSREKEDVKIAEAGRPGGYQLQVSSFKEQGDAEAFAMVLRRRGHKAYVEKAHVKGRGTWHRVKIGPFKYRRSADLYRQDFEAKERMVGFVVNPPRTRVRIAPAKAED